jgi:hypothetical protein
VCQAVEVWISDVFFVAFFLFLLLLHQTPGHLRRGVRQRPTNQQWSKVNAKLPECDFSGSLVDAGMAAYCSWIDLNRLAGGGSHLKLLAHFLVGVVEKR